MRKHQRLFNTRKLTRDSAGKIQDAADTIIGIGQYWTQEEAFETVGDANANGTSLLTISVTAGSAFYATHVMFGTNITALARIGTGALADPPTGYYWVDAQNAGLTAMISDGTSPLFVIDNTTGSTALTLRMYVPQTAYNAATNNDANHYFYGFVGGILV